jgi:hypothetical protein
VSHHQGAHALLLVTLAALSGGCERKLVPQKGDELFAIADDALMEVRMRDRTRRAEVRRAAEGGPLSYSFEQADGRVERCAASARLDAALAPLRSVRVRATLDDAEAQKLQGRSESDWVELEVRSIIADGEPFQLRLLRDPRDRSRVLARMPGQDWTVALDGTLLTLLESHCEER